MGWWQNSLFTITADTHEVRRNPEYYVMRHFSHFVRPGAKVLGTTGHFNSMAIAFRNPDARWWLWHRTPSTRSVRSHSPIPMPPNAASR